MPRLTSAASVLRCALLVWGLGHLAIGDRRGWLLVVLQPLSIAGLAVLAVQLIDGTRWLVVFVPLLALLVVWLGQAIHAHRRALALGARPGGELQAALFLPFALTVLTAFWLVGGRHGSPAATIEAYMAARVDGRPDVAAKLYTGPHTADEVAREWLLDADSITQLIESARATYGSSSGLDPARPFNSLRVRQLDEVGERAHFVVEIVRNERFETTVLGIIPTAGQRMVVVSQVLQINLVETSSPSLAAWLPLHTTTWRIDDVFDPETLL